MQTQTKTLLLCMTALGISGLSGCASSTSKDAASAAPTAIDAAHLTLNGTVDPRYQSYNVEMLEVTGGKFWKAYKDIGSAPAAAPSDSGDVPAGMSADLYQYLEPVDLANPRLRMLAKALGPAYVRVSGTWANTTFFSDADPAPTAPPEGYGGVLTKAQWNSLVDFSKAVDAPIVSSVPTSVGTRGANGVWQPEQTRLWLEYTRSIGGKVAALEFMNEPTLASMGGAPKGYDAAAYGRDYKVFREFMRKEMPQVKILGPGSVGEAPHAWAVANGGYGSEPPLAAADLAGAMGSDVDAFSYHHYGAVSLRCKAMGDAYQIKPQDSLSEEWLARTDATASFYRTVRDKFMPGKPLWNTETADAACGGNPWGSQFADTFRYLDQLGRLATQEVDMVAHNTLVASDYGMLDHKTFAPKPNYWGALLWSRLMGPTVLNSGVPVQQGKHVYAHCLRGQPGGVALLAINNDSKQSTRLDLGAAAGTAKRFTLTSTQLQSGTVQLNGQTLALTADDQLPAMTGEAMTSNALVMAPASINFVALPDAKNAACMGS